MGAPNEYYVDPAAGNDTTGDGSIGTPWATVQKALNTITRDTTNGDRINLKAGTSNVLSSALSGSTYGNGAALAPLIIQGYTSAAGDGGIGVIDGDGSVACFNDSARQFWILRDLRLTNTGAAQNTFLGNNNTFYHVQFDTGTNGGLRIGSSGRIAWCRFENLGGIACRSANASVTGCYFKNGANSASAFLQIETAGGVAHSNIFNCSGATDAVQVSSIADVLSNRFYSNGGTGQGVSAGASGFLIGRIEYNYFEGFSGTGGIAIQTTNAGTPPDIASLVQNYYFNNATNKSIADAFIDDDGTTLSGSAYVDPGNEDFSINDTAGAGAVLRAVERVMIP